MSNLSQFFSGSGGGLVPKSINNGGMAKTSMTTPLAAASIGSCNVALSGVLSAATLATVLSVSGKGAVSYLALQSVDGTSRTHRIKITIDGTVVFDNTTAVTTQTSVHDVIGHSLKSTLTPTQQDAFAETLLQFSTSLLIEYASSLTETAMTRFAYVYYTA